MASKNEKSVEKRIFITLIGTLNGFIEDGTSSHPDYTRLLIRHSKTKDPTKKRPKDEKDVQLWLTPGT